MNDYLQRAWDFGTALSREDRPRFSNCRDWAEYHVAFISYLCVANAEIRPRHLPET